MPQPITTTGIKGFLTWFAREQPALFNQIAPKLPSMVPAAFSNYTQRAAKLKAIYKSGAPSMGKLGDYYTLAPVYSTAPAISSDPIAVNYDSSLQNVTGGSVAVNYDSTLTPINTGDLDTGTTPTTTIPPVAAAANSGSASQPIANAIAQTIGAAASVVMTNNAAAAQQALVNTQLARAQAGLTPLNTSVNSLGIPTVTSTSSTTMTSLLILGAGVAAVLFLTGDKNKKKV